MCHEQESQNAKIYLSEQPNWAWVWVGLSICLTNGRWRSVWNNHSFC